MRVFSVGIEHALDMAVQRLHTADVCMHHRAPRGHSVAMSKTLAATCPCGSFCSAFGSDAM
jgi:hypothetical protein